MAIEMVAEQTTITADCSMLTVVNNTGPYDADTNPGGFGAPNELRSNLYILLLVMLNKTAGSETIAVPPYDANVADSWGIPITEDGWYEATMFACLLFDPDVEYLTGYITYYAGKFYVALDDDGQNTNPGTDDAVWKEVALPEQLTNAINLEQPDVYLAQDNFIELCYSRICAAKTFVNAQPCNCGGCDHCNKRKLYREMRLAIEGAEINEAKEAYTIAQKIVESLQVLCLEANC